MRVTRREIARCLQEHLEISNPKAILVIDAIFNTITQSLATGEEVRLHRFGKFFLRSKTTRKKVSSGQPNRKDRKANQLAVAFKGFGQLLEQVNFTLQDDLERAVWPQLFVERRTEQRDTTPPDGTAIVRISGIPVCEFQLKSLCESGSSFLVPDDAQILRNIRVGQEIDIRIHKSHSPAGPVLQRCRIVHITREEKPDMKGYFALGVKILGRLPI